MSDITSVVDGADGKMSRSLEVLKEDLQKVRTGRAHPSLLDHVEVEYYGAMTPLTQVANVTALDSRTLGVSPWEKSLASAVEKAIRDSDLGLNPASVGEQIRVPMPVLTEDRRKELIKVVRKEAEAARIAIRNVRRDSNADLKALVKDKTISEDDERRGQESIQKVTDKYIAEVDSVLLAKESDLMSV